MIDFDETDFEEEHIRLLNERDGQWLDNTRKGSFIIWFKNYQEYCHSNSKTRRFFIINNQKSISSTYFFGEILAPKNRK